MVETTTTKTPDITNWYFWLGDTGEELKSMTKEEFDDRQRRERQIFEDWLNVRSNSDN